MRFPVTRLAAVCAALVATSLWACGDSTTSPTPFEQNRGNDDPAAGPDTGGTSNPDPDPVTGPVTSVQMFPAEMMLGVGRLGGLAANPRNAKGEYVPGTRAQWSSSNPAVAAVLADTGIVTGIAPGVATITATIDGVSATARVTVVDMPPPPPDPQPVERFTLTGGVRTLEQGADTVHATIVPNVTVVLYKFVAAAGDTVGTPVEVGRTTSDAAGDFSFGTLPSATYRIVAVAPDPAKHEDGVAMIPPPLWDHVHVFITLPAK